VKRILLLSHCPRIDFSWHLAALFGESGMRVLMVDATERQKHQSWSGTGRANEGVVEWQSMILASAIYSEHQLAQRVSLSSYDVVLVESDQGDVVQAWHTFDRIVVVTDLERETLVKTMRVLALVRAQMMSVAYVHVHFHPVCAVQPSYVRYLAEQSGALGEPFHTISISAHDEALRFEMLYGLPSRRQRWSAGYRQTLQRVMNLMKGQE
jgi:hypothetical protein